MTYHPSHNGHHLCKVTLREDYFKVVIGMNEDESFKIADKDQNTIAYVKWTNIYKYDKNHIFIARFQKKMNTHKVNSSNINLKNTIKSIWNIYELLLTKTEYYL